MHRDLEEDVRSRSSGTGFVPRTEVPRTLKGPLAPFVQYFCVSSTTPSIYFRAPSSEIDPSKRTLLRPLDSGFPGLPPWRLTPRKGPSSAHSTRDFLVSFSRCDSSPLPDPLRQRFVPRLTCFGGSGYLRHRSGPPVLTRPTSEGVKVVGQTFLVSLGFHETTESFVLSTESHNAETNTIKHFHYLRANSFTTFSFPFLYMEIRIVTRITCIVKSI